MTSDDAREISAQSRRLKYQEGASAIQRCYATIGNRIFSTLTNMAGSKNTIAILSGAKKPIGAVCIDILDFG